MTPEQQIEDWLKPAHKAMADAMAAAISHAYALGAQETARKIMANVQGLDIPVAPPSVTVVEAVGVATGTSVATGIAEVARRAPKGLVDDVLEMVLKASPGLTQEQVETAVVAMDHRIAVKSVYNKLRAWERQNRRFRRHKGLWYRIADIPPIGAEQSSPQGEAGGVAPPDPFNELLHG